MQIQLKGRLTLKDLKQAIYEKLHEVEELAVHFTRGATLYINPINEHGEDVTPRRSTGEEVTKLHSNGPYRAAADELKL
jgi:hypothetical protein